MTKNFSLATWKDVLLFNILSPANCFLCEELVATAPDLCLDCWQQLKLLPAEHCSCCAVPFASIQTSSHRCGECLQKPPSFSKVWAVYQYGEGMQSLIHQVKFGKKVDVLKLLSQSAAQEFSKALQNFNPDFLLPVPLSWWRSMRRGFNQSYLLAQFLLKSQSQSQSQSQSVKKPILRIMRRAHTRAQAQQSRAERLKTLQSVFSLNNSAAVTGKRILLIDDILTTGATAQFISDKLMKAGAEQVAVFVLARVAKRARLS